MWLWDGYCRERKRERRTHYILRIARLTQQTLDSWMARSSHGMAIPDPASVGFGIPRRGTEYDGIRWNGEFSILLLLFLPRKILFVKGEKR